jgi:hypothetical protein
MTRTRLYLAALAIITAITTGGAGPADAHHGWRCATWGCVHLDIRDGAWYLGAWDIHTDGYCVTTWLVNGSGQRVIRGPRSCGGQVEAVRYAGAEDNGLRARVYRDDGRYLTF